MTEEEARLNGELRDSIQRKLEVAMNTGELLKYTPATADKITAIVGACVYEWMRINGISFPINTGITAALHRQLWPFDSIAYGVPDDDELWCDGWSIETKAPSIGDRAQRKLSFEMVPINPHFRPQ